MAKVKLTPTGTVWCLIYKDQDGNEALSSVHASEASAEQARSETGPPGRPSIAHRVVAWALLDIERPLTCDDCDRHTGMGQCSCPHHPASVLHPEGFIESEPVR